MRGETYDAVVVGSGATGSWAAKELTESGMRVALLEAGPLFNPAVDPHAPGASRGNDRQPIQSRCYAFTERTSHLFVDDVNNPYSVPEGFPFDWIRSQQVGGRLHLWDRVSLRMSDHEFKAASRDGVGEDWPISYADLAAYYDRVERFMGVHGESEQLPQLPDGDFLAAPPLTTGERRLKSAIEQRWKTRTLTPARRGRHCPDAMLSAAMRTGRLALRPDAVVREVLTDPATGSARGVAFVDRASGRDEEVKGRVIVLCASAIESTRLLLNSVTPEHPNGLANSSGTLGRYLMDHTYGISLEGIAPLSSRDEQDESSNGAYIPAFRNVTEEGVDFIRSYGVETQVFPFSGDHSGGWRRRLRPRRGPYFWISAFGEVLPTEGNTVSVNTSLKDAWGIPVADVRCSYGDNELSMARDQVECLKEMVAAAGFEVHRSSEEVSVPGLSSHELGTARMGADPATSVLNSFNQSWDVRNLFVTDGACFTSGGYQNPTLTMMALTVRACDYIIEQSKRGEL